MSYLSHHHPNQNPLNPATCVSFKFLKVVLVSGVLSRNEDRFLFTASVREEELLHRLFPGLFCYNNSYCTAQGSDKRVLPMSKCIYSNYTPKTRERAVGGSAKPTVSMGDGPE